MFNLNYIIRPKKQIYINAIKVMIKMFEKLLITKNVCEKVCQWSIRLLCAVMFFPVANVFGTELDCRFMFIFPTSLFCLDWFSRADAFMTACGSLLHQTAVSTLTNQTMMLLGQMVDLVSLIRDTLQLIHF